MTPTLSDDELLRYTGQAAVRDVQTATGLIAEAESAVSAFYWHLWRNTLALPGAALRYCTTTVTLGFDHADAVILGAILAAPATYFYIANGRPPVLQALVVLFALTAILYAIFYAALRTKPSERGKDRDAARREEWSAILREREVLVAARRAWLAHLHDLRKLAARIEQAARRSAAIAGFLATDIEGMSGPNFERFLERVFVTLGYPEVVRTQDSGDQGIDLVVGDGKERVAIQAKRYQGTVGNAAVQQAFAGMAHYGCDRCAVVTNSTFTPAAVALAASTGCKLIDGARLRRIIQGKEFV